MPRSQIGEAQVYDKEIALQVELEEVMDNNTEQFNPETMNNYDLFLRANITRDNDTGALFVPETMNNYSLLQQIKEAKNTANDGNFSFYNISGSDDYIDIASTTYLVFATFVFRGTETWTPTKAKFILSRAGTTGISYIRVYDATNNQTIIEFDWTSEVRTLYDITGILNLPTESAIFEFQARRSASNAGRARIHAAGIYP